MAKVDYKARLDELNGALKTGQEKYEGLAPAVKVEEGKGLVVSAELRDEAARIVAENTEIKAEIVRVEQAAGIRKMLDEPAGDGFNSGAAVSGGLWSPQGKSLGAMFTESDPWRAYVESGGRGGTKSIRADFDGLSLRDLARAQAMERKDIYTAVGGQMTDFGFGSSTDTGIVERMHRKVRVRDLLQAGPTTSNVIEFIRVTGFQNGAKPVAEREDASGNPLDTSAIGGVDFMLKPESNLTFEPDSVMVRTIAHTIRVSKTVLDDEPRLRRIIDTEMLYGLQLVEDAQLLAGDGSNAGIKGLLNQEGMLQYIQRNGGSDTVPAAPWKERKSESIRRSITLGVLAFYDMTGAVVNPLDWEDIELEKDAQGRPIIVTNIAIGAEKQVWRLPVSDTPAIAEGHFLVGAFGLGAKVWDRQQPTVEISTEDRDNFVRNAATIRAEQRLALEVPRPESFVHGRYFGEPTDA